MFQIDDLFRSTISTTAGLIYSLFAAIYFPITGRPKRTVLSIAAQRLARGGESSSSRTLLFVATFAVLFGLTGFRDLNDLISTAKGMVDEKSPSTLFVAALLLTVLLDTVVLAAIKKQKPRDRQRAMLRDAISVCLLLTAAIEFVIYIATLNRFGIEKFYDEKVGLDGLKLIVLVLCLLGPSYLAVAVLMPIRATRPWIKYLVLGGIFSLGIISLFSSIVSQDDEVDAGRDQSSEIEDIAAQKSQEAPNHPAPQVDASLECSEVTDKGLRVNFYVINHSAAPVTVTVWPSRGRDELEYVGKRGDLSTTRIFWKSVPGIVGTNQKAEYVGYSFNDSDPSTFRDRALEPGDLFSCRLSYRAAFFNRNANSDERETARQENDKESSEGPDAPYDFSSYVEVSAPPSRPLWYRIAGFTASIIIFLTVFSAGLYGLFRGAHFMLRHPICWILGAYGFLSVGASAITVFHEKIFLTASEGVALSLSAGLIAIIRYASTVKRRPQDISWFSRLHGALFGVFSCLTMWSAMLLLVLIFRPINRLPWFTQSTAGPIIVQTAEILSGFAPMTEPKKAFGP